MIYERVKEGVFLDRPNRFIANVIIDGKREVVHVKNTGRCREILMEGAKVYLQRSLNPNRKTAYDLIAVEKRVSEGKKIIINIDSQIPNNVVEEAILQGKIIEIGKTHKLKREASCGKSRFDFYYEKDGTKGFIEVKGVTLEEVGHARFPDAPTLRGSKHLKELIRLQNEGYENYVFFLVQMNHPHIFSPNYERDLEFSNTLIKARDEGVKILCYDSFVGGDYIRIDKRVEKSF
jgi:sugar fermentation stimulation protein A